MHDTDEIETVMRYHERTKHQLQPLCAPDPAQLDWANQPNPFRRYEGAPLVRLPLLGPDDAPASPHYDDLYHRGSVPSVPLTIRALSRLLQYALAISAWKQAGATRWALRCNPSSGNLHPTEGYLLIGALPGLGDAAGLYHYAPREHGLERRADCSAALFTALMREFPAQAFLVGLSSIHWREAWKYGERAFRYCQHDAGHAIGALRIAAATLGWSAIAAAWPGRRDDRRPARLEPGRGLRGCRARAPGWPCWRSGRPTSPGTSRPARTTGSAAPRFGPRAPTDSGVLAWCREPAQPRRAGALGGHRRSRRRHAQTGRRGARVRHARNAGGRAQRPSQATDGPLAGQIILQRRSLLACDGRTSIAAERFYRMLARVMPRVELPASQRPMPWDTIGLGSDHPPRTVRPSGRWTRARAVPACSRPNQDGQAEARDAPALRLVDAAGLSGRLAAAPARGRRRAGGSRRSSAATRTSPATAPSRSP